MLPRCGYVVSGFSRTTCIKQLNRGVERCGAEMHVPLRHAELAVSGELLDRPCRRTSHRQMRTERVSQSMRTACRKTSRPSGLPHVLTDDVLCERRTVIQATVATRDMTTNWIGHRTFAIDIRSVTVR